MWKASIMSHLPETGFYCADRTDPYACLMKRACETCGRDRVEICWSVQLAGWRCLRCYDQQLAKQGRSGAPESSPEGIASDSDPTAPIVLITSAPLRDRPTVAV